METFQVSINKRQLAIILAALRDVQSVLGKQAEETLDTMYPEHFADTPGVVADNEIDDLCEMLNAG
jgi:hypothetical protein